MTKCFYHKEYNEIFCKDCNKYICKRCETDISNPENIHDNHATIRPEEYQQTIKNIKKNLRFKSYDQCVKFIDDKQEEITKDFNKQCEKSKKDIEDTIEKLQDIKKNYIAKYDKEKKENINNKGLDNILEISKKIKNISSKSIKSLNTINNNNTKRESKSLYEIDNKNENYGKENLEKEEIEKIDKQLKK